MVNLLFVIVTAAILLGTHLAPVHSSTSTHAYWAFYCAGGNFTPTSTYARSLARVAAQLPQRVASSSLHFASFQRGHVHAVAQCRGDSTALSCKRCIAGGVKYALDVLCNFRQIGIIFRDTCTVAYCQKNISEYPIGNEMDFIATNNDFSPVVLQDATFNTSVGALARAVARRTAVSHSHFGTGQIEVVQAQYRVTIYGLGQCLPTLSTADCELCLKALVDAIDISVDMTTGRAAKVWCNYRFSPYKFFRGKPALDIPAEGLPQKRGKKKKHKNKNTIATSIMWALIALAIILSLLLLSVVAWIVYWWRNRVQQRNSSGQEVQCTGKAEEVESQPSALDKFENIMEMAKKKKEVTIFLDYDGTLAPIVRDPERAYMSNEMRGVLQNVANLFRTSIVSGRAREKLSDFVRIKNINYIGSHGMDIMIETSTTEFASTSLTAERKSYKPAEQYVDLINEVHNFLVHATGQINGANIEHNKYCVSLHYRNVAKKDLPRVRRVKDEMLENMKDQIKFSEGHKVYEFRPLIDWNKGDAVLYVLKELGLEDSFAIYIGDDRTDEDAFKVLRQRNSGNGSNNGFGILVAENGRETAAYYSLKNPAHVMEFLHKLVTWKQEEKNN